MPPEPHSLDAAIDWMRKRFDPASANGLAAVYEFTITGEGGGSIVMRVGAGRCELARGQEPRADVRFRVAAPDYLALLAGRENPDLLYMAGRLEIEGDLSLASKVRTLFRGSD